MVRVKCDMFKYKQLYIPQSPTKNVMTGCMGSSALNLALTTVRTPTVTPHLANVHQDVSLALITVKMHIAQ